MNNRFNPKAQNVLRRAKSTAERLGHTYIGSEHLLIALAGEDGTVASHFLSSRGLSAERVTEAARDLEGSGSPSRVNAKDMTPRLKRILESAGKDAGAAGVGTEHLLMALLGEEDAVAVRLIRTLGVGISELRADFGITMDALPQAAEKQEKSGATPSLAAYSRDLTALARQGKLDPVIGREEETERTVRILCRRQKNNPCLIGEPGVGKTAVVEGLAQRIVRREVPEPLLGHSLLALDLSALISGAKYRGEFEERLRGVMAEISKRTDLILFIDEVHTIVGAGAAEGAMDAANILKPLLSRGESRVIGATTLAEYHRYIEKDHALERRFQPVFVEEPDDETTFRILCGLRDRYEAHHRLKIGDDAVRAAIRLSRRYLCDRRMPDKAIDLLDEAAAGIRVAENTEPEELRQTEERRRAAALGKETAIRKQDFEAAAKCRDAEKTALENYDKMRQEWERRKATAVRSVTERDVAAVVSGMTGIPLDPVSGTEEGRLRELEPYLKREVVGQDAAAEALAAAILRSRLGLGDPGRPAGTFLFTGPTGVGKTEMAKALARFLFGTEEALFRFDMSEYMEKHTVSRLIGSPPGYVGFEEGGLLTDAIRRKPYAVVLFDEMEKAHPDVSSLLLQITEEGALTDTHGRRADFRNAVVILTANIQAAEKRATGFLREEGEDRHRAESAALERFFRPELLGRMDEILFFSPLTEKDLRSIARKFADECLRRARDEGYDITVPPSVVDELISRCDRKEGARPLRAAVRRRLTDAVARAILDGSVTRTSHFEAETENGRIRFRPTSAASLTAERTI